MLIAGAAEELSPELTDFSAHRGLFVEPALDALDLLTSPAAVRLLVVDACRSGTVTRVKGVTAAPSFELRIKDDTDTTGMAILTSSAAGESRS